MLFFGAALPQIAGLSGEAKSYAERLFHYPSIGRLGDQAAREAIQLPILGEGGNIDPEALNMIIAKTHGCPYFLQEWRYQAWNLAAKSPINVADIGVASSAAIHRLDQGF